MKNNNKINSIVQAEKIIQNKNNLNKNNDINNNKRK